MLYVSMFFGIFAMIRGKNILLIMTYQIYWEPKDVENDAKRYVLFEIEFYRKNSQESQRTLVVG